MDTASKFTVPAIAFLLTLGFGLWLSYSGKPYNGPLFNVHKLIALGATILTAIQIYQALKATDVQAILIGLIVIAGLGVVALFATGALMSMGKLPYKVLLTIHNIAPFLVGISLVALIYILAGRKS
jgi:hypothetical protein